MNSEDFESEVSAMLHRRAADIGDAPVNVSARTGTSRTDVGMPAERSSPRSRLVLAVAASVVLVVGGLFIVTRLRDDPSDTVASGATQPTPSPAATDTAADDGQPAPPPAPADAETPTPVRPPLAGAAAQPQCSAGVFDQERNECVVEVEEPFFHTIAVGDRLSTIAEKYNVSVQAIISANPQMDPNLIIAGELVKIPGAATSAPICPESYTAVDRDDDGVIDVCVPFDDGVQPLRLLPDPERWVVVDAWLAQEVVTSSQADLNGLQIDVAPLDSEGVPQLGRRIMVRYQVGSLEDFDRQWGDASSLGAPVEFAFGGGVGRVVTNLDAGLAVAQVFSDGTFVSMQTQDPDADLLAVAQSLALVDMQTWERALADAELARLLAVEDVMRQTDAPEALNEPLPHWVLPEPWELEWVTDMTIWTPEQHAQRDALAEANRPPGQQVLTADDHRSFYFGFGETADAAAAQFVPQVAITVLVFADAPEAFHPINYETITGLGLDGVISPVGGGAPSSYIVELGRDQVRVNIQSSYLSKEAAVEMVGAMEFATSDPLEGVVIDDDRFQPVELAGIDQERGPSWHAAWEHPTSPDRVLSVWRLTVPELRVWLLGRGAGLTVPNDIWDTLAAGGAVDLGWRTTYDPQQQLVFSFGDVDPSELIPIELDDWKTLVEPFNTDPLNPR